MSALIKLEKGLEVSEEHDIIVVQDACILFDLVDLDLLKVFFQLDLTVLTTPQVIAEIIDEDQQSTIEAHVQNGDLKVDKDGSYESIAELFDKFPGLSVADCSVLELALRKKAVVLSSDGGLRKISRRKNCEVHGTLWIIQELHDYGIIGNAAAIEKLKMYASINLRAPKKEIKLLIAKFDRLQNR